jgi:4-diphosphocytidyl-2-C-methyl-D-erythritol kinase
MSSGVALRARAPAKVNLCLFLGPTREDGRHELVSVVQSLSLADELTLAPAAGDAGADRVVCPGVEGENLAARALRAFREATGWDAPPQELRIDKRVPVAAGMGGGSADAAATLRLAAAAAGVEDPALLMRLAADLGADIPALLTPGRALTTGAGERVRRLASPAGVDSVGVEAAGAGEGEPGMGFLVLRAAERLSTADVYAEADRLGLPRSAGGLREALRAVEAALESWERELPLKMLINELEPAARSLCPVIDGALAQVRAAGADVALVSGSGPTVVGLFLGPSGPAAADSACAGLASRRPPPLVARPVGADFAAVSAIRHNG